ncbi:ABC transporter ATP-binding protein [Frateuria sp. GZRR33]|uniref:ABC transporter ATP-binding protein n=1 Tax=Frateuria sp. GZRR33 TaxID=3351535 RepID=UPI003EDCA6DA
MVGKADIAVGSDVLVVEGLGRNLGGCTILDSLDFRMPARSVFALLGPNGAGKTTTLNIVAGLDAPDAGAVRICGYDVQRQPIRARQSMAYVPDEPALYDVLSVIEYVEFVGALWGMEAADALMRAEALLVELGLAKNRDARLGTLSRGTRQKVALAGALVHEPSLLVMDEPFTGLDPIAARQIRQVLLRVVQAGASVLMSTHMMDTAQQLATHVGLLMGGRLVAVGETAQVMGLAREGAKTLEEAYVSLVGGR